MEVGKGEDCREFLPEDEGENTGLLLLLRCIPATPAPAADVAIPITLEERDVTIVRFLLEPSGSFADDDDAVTVGG